MGQSDKLLVHIIVCLHLDEVLSSYECEAGIRVTISVSQIGAFYLVHMHLGGVGGVKPPLHFHCVLHAKRGWVGPNSM